MRSPRGVPPGSPGDKAPRIEVVPPYVSSAGQEALELCDLAGLPRDVWQQRILVDSLGERRDGKWAALEVGVCAPRQNGKNGTAEPREIVGLFLLGEELITHSAHEFKTSLESFRRTLEVIEGTREFSRRVKRVMRSHGEEGIELRAAPTVSAGTGRLVRHGSQRIQYRTRTKSGGRGLTGDLLVLDEAMVLPEEALGALFSTGSARPNPQFWYLGSAVDQEIHEHGHVFARLRRRALEGTDPRLMFVEFSAAHDLAELLEEPEFADDPRVWAQANPALEVRITEEFVRSERQALALRTFCVERLGAGDWPEDETDDGPISRDAWAACADHRSGPAGPVCFAYDVRPNRAASAIAAAGVRADGRIHVEVIDHRDGTGWLAKRLAELEGAHPNVGIVGDERGPAGAMLADFASAHVTPRLLNGSEYAQACGMFFDAVNQDALRHLGTRELTEAVRGAAQRPLGDVWAWSRRSSTADISPLVAATLALWGARTISKSVYETRGLVSV